MGVQGGAGQDMAVKNALCTRSHISPGTWDLWELQWDVPRSCETLVSLVLGSHLSRHVSHSSYLTYHYKASIRYKIWTLLHPILRKWLLNNIKHRSRVWCSPQLTPASPVVSSRAVWLLWLRTEPFNSLYPDTAFLPASHRRPGDTLPSFLRYFCTASSRS